MTEINDSNDLEEGISINSLESYSQYVDSINPVVKGVADRVSSLACPDSDNYIVCQSKALCFFVSRVTCFFNALWFVRSSFFFSPDL